jgi:hypothetical protein
MADLRVLSTGREFRRIDEGTAKLLEELFPGNLERINPAPQRPARPVSANAESAAIATPAEPIWKIIKAEMSGQICVQCSWLRQIMRYAGKPSEVYKMKVGPHTIPTSVADEYVRLKLQETDPAALLEWEQEARRREREDLYNKGGTLANEV